MEPKVEIDPVRSAVAKVAPFPFKATVCSKKDVELLKALGKNYPTEEGDARLVSMYHIHKTIDVLCGNIAYSSTLQSIQLHLKRCLAV